MRRRLPEGLYGIVDASLGDPVQMGTDLARLGCPVIQLRAKDWSISAIAAAAECLVAVLRPLGSLLIVNDHVQVARDVGADGVHLGDDDASVDLARQILPATALVGRSTRTLRQVETETCADYLGFGPVFWTRSRLNLPPPRGIELLTEAIERSDRPVVAIGGVTAERLPALRRAGCRHWACIGALYDCENLSERIRELEGGRR